MVSSTPISRTHRVLRVLYLPLTADSIAAEYSAEVDKNFSSEIRNISSAKEILFSERDKYKESEEIFKEGKKNTITEKLICLWQNFRSLLVFIFSINHIYLN